MEFVMKGSSGKNGTVMKIAFWVWIDTKFNGQIARLFAIKQ